MVDLYEQMCAGNLTLLQTLKSTGQSGLKECQQVKCSVHSCTICTSPSETCIVHDHFPNPVYPSDIHLYLQIQVVQEDSSSSSGEDSEDDAMEEDSDTLAKATESNQSDLPTIDEDGFTLVQRRRR